MIIDEQHHLAHYGILRRSGRYPWGSGQNENTRNRMFLDHVKDLEASGMSQVEIARGFGVSTTELRAYKTYAIQEQRATRRRQIEKLAGSGMSNVAVAAEVGVSEAQVRSVLKGPAQAKASTLNITTDMLRGEIAKNPYLDVGKGVENHLGISKEQLRAAVSQLESEGYELYRPKIQQLGTGKDTNFKVLCPPGTTYRDLMTNQDKIAMPFTRSEDMGRTWNGRERPLGVDPSRVQVIYGSEGGRDADGVIYVRPGVHDISLGDARYAQVRIKVGDGHYLKGMAIYKDDLPDGVDLQFNTNKENKGDPLKAMKPIESSDPTNPFGAITRPARVRTLDDGTTVADSAMNIVYEEGKWDTWSRNLSTQMLSKQSPVLAKQQLQMTYERRQEEYERIMAMTNPVVRKKLLKEFADGTDASAVHMKAAALPRQATKVLIPLNAMRETEVYAPGFENGERVVLIRYPHGGKFEIPELTVNNRRRAGKDLLGDSPDAIGISAKVAARLSGADFDGDTVLVIPNNNGRVKSRPALKGLEGFDPQETYRAYPGMKRISATHMQKQMGDVSNLITDMTLRQASEAEMARAVRHSMVVIDSYKHTLDYRQSAIDNGIAALKQKYQDGPKSGATTLISRAKREQRVDDRREARVNEGGAIDPKTGKKRYVPTGKTYVDKDGVTVRKTIKSTELAETDDAFTLSSGTPMERVYAEHSNRLKAMANQARLDYENTPPSEWNPTAKRTYALEVESIDAKLDQAQKNAPLERQAQAIANVTAKQVMASDSSLDRDDRKKVESMALEEARNRTGAKKNRINLTDREWEAVQAGAISSTKLSAVLDNADMDRVRELALPPEQKLMTSTRTRRARGMLDQGYTRAEVAKALGVSLTTLDESVNGS